MSEDHDPPSEQANTATTENDGLEDGLTGLEDGLGGLEVIEVGLMESDIRCRGFLPAGPPGDTKWRVNHTGPTWHSHKLILEKDNPFLGLSIADTSSLNQQSERGSCPVCTKSRKFFCYTCYVPLANLAPFVPKVQLPVLIDIVKHPREVDGKSTAVHAPIIAPEHAKIYTHPDIPDYRKEKALLVFPSKDSQTLQQIVDKELAKHKHLDTRDQAVSFPFDKIVFIDSTWNQCKRIYHDERITGLPCVILDSRNTIFWRYQKGKPKEYLATIEAIYYFLVDYDRIVLGRLPYKGQYDNMLFLFKFMYDKIHELYDHNTLRAYTRD